MSRLHHFRPGCLAVRLLIRANRLQAVGPASYIFGNLQTWLPLELLQSSDVLKGCVWNKSTHICYCCTLKDQVQFHQNRCHRADTPSDVGLLDMVTDGTPKEHLNKCNKLA